MKENKTIIKREELYEKVWSKSSVEVAKEYKLSDVGLGKICNSLRVPKPQPGYWNKVKAGIKVAKTKLPPLREGERDNYELRNNEYTRLEYPEEIIAQVENERKPENSIKVPDEYRPIHYLLKEVKIVKKSEEERFWAYPTHAIFNYGIYVYNDSQERALRIFSALFKAIESRGLKLNIVEKESKKEVEVEVNEIKFTIKLTEKLKQIPSKTTGVFSRKFDFIPSGILSIQIDGYFGAITVEAKTISDTPIKKLEYRLNDFLIALIKCSEAKKQATIIWEAERRKWQEEENKKQDFYNRYAKEKKNYEKLLNDSKDYYRCYKLRLYIQAVKENYTNQNGTIPPGCEMDEWLKWANLHADRMDPLKVSPPSILDTEGRYKESNW
jgi:hypothetical protein